MCSSSLQVSGDVAFDWPIRETRFWSYKEIMEKKLFQMAGILFQEVQEAKDIMNGEFHS